MTDPVSAPKGKFNRKALAAVPVVLALLTVAWYWWDSRSYESTDNAFIDGDIVQVASRVPGQVVKVHVRDNQRVKRGDLLVELDPSDYEARLAEARARLKEIASRQTGARQESSPRPTVVTGAVADQRNPPLQRARPADGAQGPFEPG
jgi:membrane fusion protein (multidrug efflux system)